MRRTLRISAFPEDESEKRHVFLCPSCKNALELHQPDTHNPERMLGICPGCHRWTLIGVFVDGQVKMISIPDFQ